MANNEVATASNSEPETGAVRVAKKRGRPPKISATQQPPFFLNSVGIIF